MKNKLSSILFVDDEVEIQVELKKFLQRFSHDVIVASDGEEGLALFKSNSPEIVISDIRMPKMNGIDMAKEIKKLSPNQIIIFTTAHNDNSYFLEAIDMQVDGYILKPVDLSLLKEKINTVSRNITLQREIKQHERILNDIAQMQGNMLAVYDENGFPLFYNKKLLSFLGYVSLKEFLKRYKSLSEKFEINDDYFYPKNNHMQWVNEIKNIEKDKRIISIQDTKRLESKLFLVTLSDKTQSNNTIVTFSEVTSIIEQKLQYQHDAYIDELTQIDNRARFNILFDEAIEESKQNESSLSIMLLDIDNFKKVNDGYGHIVGDNILKLFTTLILDNIRSEDSFSRWGGEEFVLLLADTTLESAKDIAEKLRLIIATYDFGIKDKLTCSFGVTIKQDNDSSESLFKRVDKALYKAKDKGRNRVEVSK